jgi:hypothetical protein
MTFNEWHNSICCGSPSCTHGCPHIDSERKAWTAAQEAMRERCAELITDWGYHSPASMAVQIRDLPIE